MKCPLLGVRSTLLSISPVDSDASASLASGFSLYTPERNSFHSFPTRSNACSDLLACSFITHMESCMPPK